MRIVIDIPEGMLDELRTRKFPIQEAYRLCAMILNGTPLPKGHGRIGDFDIAEEWLEVGYALDDVPALLEADKEGAKDE